jgi:prephenate dehydrogenase
VASTKKEVCAEGRRLFGVPCHFIGSHPMAGSEKFGAEHGTPDFYEGSVALMEPLGAELDADAHAGVRGLWEHLGARVVEIDPAAHDASLARTSHVPHVAAAAIALAADALGDVDNLAGGGFRDTTRIADGRPEVWRDICLTNASAVDEGLDALVEEIQAFRACLKEGDADLLESFFERARLARRRIVQQ